MSYDTVGGILLGLACATTGAIAGAIFAWHRPLHVVCDCDDDEDDGWDWDLFEDGPPPSWLETEGAR